jgi:hypothetical protein
MPRHCYLDESALRVDSTLVLPSRDNARDSLNTIVQWIHLPATR